MPNVRACGRSPLLGTPSPPVSLNAKSLKNRGSGLPEQAAGWPVTSNHPTVVGRGPRSGDERAAIEIDDRSRGKADGHEREDLPRDIFTHTDAANGQRGCRLGEHVAASGFRHAGAYRRVDDPGRDAVHPDAVSYP